MEIRPYSESDEAAVAELWREVFPGSPSWNHPETDIQRKLAVRRELFLVATIDSEIVGTAMAGYDGHRGWVYYVAVSPRHRRQGIGTALMKRAEEELAGLGCPKLNLQVRASNEEVVAFYRKLGYETEERISMGKRLATEQQYPEPTVGALIFDPEGRLFLMRSHKWRGKYVVPGGHIELGERMKDALRREVKEETNLDVHDIRFLCFQEFLCDDGFWKPRHFIFFDFACRTNSTDVRLNDEAQEYVWVSLEEALELPIEPYTEVAIRAYLKVRAR